MSGELGTWKRVKELEEELQKLRFTLEMTAAEVNKATDPDYRGSSGDALRKIKNIMQRMGTMD